MKMQGEGDVCSIKRIGSMHTQTAMKKILVVDDEPHILELICYNLEKQGYHAICLQDGLAAWTRFEKEVFDMVLLDIMMPGMDGLTLCRKIRDKGSVPIMMISAKIEEFDKVLALELGADDYMTKPFSVRELMARVKSILRRSESQMLEKPGDTFRFKEFTLIPSEHKFLKGDQEIPLTLMEYQIMELLLKNPGKVMSRDIMTEYIWGTDFYGDTRTIDVHIRHLREKMEEDASNPRFIHAVRGVGYKLQEK